MSTASVRRPMLDELREFARANIVPVNATIGLSAVIVCALDFCSPILGAWGLLLIAAVVAVAALWMLWTAKKRAPATGAVWRLVVGAVLAFMAIGTTAASTRAAQGGWIASKSERAGAVQRALFDISQDVARVQEGVDKANATLGVLATPGTGCQDFDCAFFEAAPVSKFQELMGRGVALPTCVFHAIPDTIPL